MMRFRHWLNETNTTAILSYGRDFQVDVTTGDWDVEDYNGDGEDKEKLKPWEVENATYANQRRNDILRWAKAGFNNLPEVITDKSLPLTPDWQSHKR